MRPKKPKAPLDANGLYEVAVRALARRARSSGEIRTLLLRRKAAKADIDAIIHRLRENGYLDDARFARSFVASRIENRMEGRSRVRRDLAARRVRPDIAEEAVNKGFEGVEESKLLRQYLERKLRIARPLDRSTALGSGKPSAVQSLYRRLLCAGFRSDTIVREMKRLLNTSSKQETDEETASLDEVLEAVSESEEAES
jgi:regulatory protein